VLNSSGFAVQEQHTTSSNAVPGTVIGQTPAGGAKAPRGSTVVVTVSDGPPQSATVPSVVGMTESKAISTLYAAGFTAKVIYTPSSADKVGVVIYQSPAGGSSASPGSQVYITVGKAAT
jgi:serine/threonine-protein kinase